MEIAILQNALQFVLTVAFLRLQRTALATAVLYCAILEQPILCHPRAGVRLAAGLGPESRKLTPPERRVVPAPSSRAARRGARAQDATAAGTSGSSTSPSTCTPGPITRLGLSLH